MPASPPQRNNPRRSHRRLLYRLEAELEPLMFLLAIAWLWLFAVELFAGIEPWQEKAMLAIWAAFIFEFLFKLYLAPRRVRYLAENWLTALALVVPAFRAFRLLRAIRVLSVARVASTTRIVRALTSTRRFYRDLKEAQGETPEPEMHVGVVVLASPAADVRGLADFAREISAQASVELDEASGLRWRFDVTAPRRLESDDARLAADFLDEASVAMAQGPFDAVVVISDVMLVSRRRKVRFGLASPTARIVTLSTRKLLATPRGEAERALAAESVRANGTALLLHLLGHIAGLDHAPQSEVMRPFAFRESRRGAPGFTAAERESLRRRARRLPERELRGRAVFAALVFHVLMALRHPAQLLIPLARNRAPLLPLSLPGLATAAVAPCFLLVFTAEIWDVGLGMSNAVAAMYASITVIAATLFLARAQSLFLPRKERNVLTEHLAVANSVIFLSILLACIGLFVLVGALMLAIELFVFPVDLMQTWPTLDQPKATFADKLRLSAFIATIGVSTGALAGGFESRRVIRNLALFEDET